MIRFILKRTQKTHPEIPMSENYETLDCEAPELEGLLTSGGFDLERGLFDVYSIVGAAPVDAKRERDENTCTHDGGEHDK